eukprot:scaffold82327_cov63-Phaeocystis_antarctica.AAC.1
MDQQHRHLRATATKYYFVPQTLLGLRLGAADSQHDGRAQLDVDVARDRRARDQVAQAAERRGGVSGLGLCDAHGLFALDVHPRGRALGGEVDDLVLHEAGHPARHL